ncbi:MAG: succinylglutamate desuccinylase/aspartoacylase family protein [Gammaproteobacteria bacterium]|nr:succinylglutamate desuccinylase/aspartoacylase family protein [Gammaproteobacteria bacterium]
MLTILDHLPDGLLAAEPADLARLLGGPTLIHLPGRRERPLFVSTLLHGNEDTSWRAVRELLQRYERRELPRALSLFIGNVAAAAAGVRRLEGQLDYNRAWPGGEATDGPECAVMRAVVEEMRARHPFASIDIHNNTGLNPHYACVNRLDAPFLRLATLFSRTVIYFLRPRGVQSLAFAELCPAVTVECGKAGNPQNTEHALEFVEACLHLAEFPRHPVSPHDIDLYHTVATVGIRDGIDFGFDAEARDLSLPGDLDRHNFQDLAPGTLWGRQDPSRPLTLKVSDEAGNDVTARYFHLDTGGTISLRVPSTPSMLTLDLRVIRQDCLCYLMERLPCAP